MASVGEMSDTDSQRMPLTGHLQELRSGLIRSLCYIAGAFLCVYFFSDKVIVFLEKPLLSVLPKNEQFLYFTGITDKFFIYLQVSIVVAICVVSPLLLYELWRFVSPALYSHEKKFALPFVGFASMAFLLGLLFAYYIVLPLGYKFLIDFGSPQDRAMITLTSYFSLTLKMLLGIAAVFELPVVLLLLVKIGVIDAGFLESKRSYAFVLCSIVAAVITPSPDVFTMVLVLVPLYLLYEVSIMGAKWIA